MKNHFSIKEAIVFGWHKVKAHSGLVFQLILVLFAIEVVSAIVQKVLEGTALGSLASFALTVLSTFVGTGVMLITLKLARGDHAQFNQILPPWQLVWKYFCSGIVVGLLMLLPFIAAGLVAVLALMLLVPQLFPAVFTVVNTGAFFQATVTASQNQTVLYVTLALLFAAAVVSSVFLGLRYAMARYAIIDGAEIIESVRQSAKLTRGVKWHLLGFVAVLVLLNIAGVIALLVGLLVTIPITMFAMAHVYLKLKAHHNA
jgi:hypothetical protein